MNRKASLRFFYAFSYLLSAAFAIPGSAAAHAAESLPYYSQPSISADGAQVAFVSGGDIWTVAASGGEARILISDPATESRPLYSPDGQKLAFVSTRTGRPDIYVLSLSTGELKRVTYDASPHLDSWSPDSREVYFSTPSHDIEYMNDIYRVAMDGGTPMPVTSEPYVNEYFGAPSPDGRTLAFSARGITSAQWWRKGHSHLDESEIWLLDLANISSRKYERLAGGDEKDLWPMWSKDGKTVYYVSDRGGSQNVWEQKVFEGGEAKAVQLTHFDDGRVLWPSIAANGSAIVFEHKFGIWKLNLADHRTEQLQIHRFGAPAGPSTTHATVSARLDEMRLSPDGKKIAYIAHGEVFATSAKDGGSAFRVTRTAARESQVSWSPDSTRLVYVSERDGPSDIYQYSFDNHVETRLTATGESYLPRFSPDGKSISFVRDGKELCIVDPSTKEERVLATAALDLLPDAETSSMAWSPDSQWIAFLANGEGLFRDVHVVARSGGESRPVSFLSDTESSGVVWSPDGKYLLLETNQRTEQGEVARIDLVRHTPLFREDEFRDLFHEQTPKPLPSTPPPISPAPTTSPVEPKESPAAEEKTGADQSAKPAKAKPQPVKIEFGGIGERLNMLPIGLNASALQISPDGKWLLLSAEVAGRNNLYVYPLDELAKEPPVARQLTSSAGGKQDAQFSEDSKAIFYLEDGKIQTMPLTGGAAHPVDTTAEMDIDFNQEKMQVFDEAWTYLRDAFFDSKFHGVDWPAMRIRYSALAAASSTPDETREIVSLMLGELNASHLGIGSSAHAPDTVGRLLADFDPAVYASSGKLQVMHIVPQSPAEVAGLRVGDTLIKVAETTLTPTTNLDEVLDYTIGHRVPVTVMGADGKQRDLVIKPANHATEGELRYREWVERNRAYVEKISHGRLGYVDMEDMSDTSLRRLYRDLDTKNFAKEGVVVDVRSNTGGFVNPYAIDTLARRGYIHLTPRGGPTGPMRSALGQHALERPTILLTNRESLSDAEDFSQGYHALHLGKIVGEPTGGWIIFTGGIGLIDGSVLRLPEDRVTTEDGEPMEMHPRPVDIPVVRPIGESYAQKDSQLDVAVEELLRQIDSKTSSRDGGN